MRNVPAHPAPLAAMALCLLATACSAPQGGGGGFAFELFVDKATPEPVAAWQVSLLAAGGRHDPLYDCETLKKTCLNTQVLRDKLVTLTDAQGREHPALLFTAQPQATDGGNQDVSITATAGTDYRLIIEALSTTTPPRLVGTSCTALPDGIRPGANKAILAEPLAINNPSLNCNPRWE